jgi:hypothetical protein
MNNIEKTGNSGKDSGAVNALFKTKGAIEEAENGKNCFDFLC